VSVRVVLAVALAAALFAASAPAVDRARVAHSDAVLEREADRLAAGVDALTARSGPGGRWVVTVRVPARSWGHAGGRLAIGDPAGVSWRPAGGVSDAARLPLPVVEGVVLTEPGRHRLVVRLLERDGEPAVAVDRLEFKSEEATTAPYARPVR